MKNVFELARHACLFLTGVAVLSVTYGVASAPTRTASRLGLRGLMRREAIAESPSWAAIEPFVRWLGVRLGGVLSDAMYARIDAMIMRAGDYLGLTPEEYVALSAMSSVGGALFGKLAAIQMEGNEPLYVLIGILFGAALPYLQISDETQRRALEISRRLPYAIDLMTLSMSAGLDFPGAVRQVVDKSSNRKDALIFEFRRLLQELQLGRTRKQALADFAVRCPTTQVTEFVVAITQAEERGNPVAEVLQIQAGVSRTRRTAAGEEAAAKAGTKMVGPLMSLFACIILLLVGPMVLTAIEASK